MHAAKYHRLRTDCQAAISDDNLEKCFELLTDGLDDRTDAFNQMVVLRGRLNGLLRDYRTGGLSYDEYSRSRSQIRVAMLEFTDRTLKPEDVSLMRRIHDRILIVACNNGPANWERLFPEAFYSHICIIRYGDEVPTEFQAPDVIIFDDLDCPGIGNRARMKVLSESVPHAHLLYVGAENPFKDGTAAEQAIFRRMANANSIFTIHARMHELLEFRRIYGQFP